VKEGDLLTDEQVENKNQEVSKMPSAHLKTMMLKDKANNAELAIAVAAEMQVVEAKTEEMRVWFEEAVDAKKIATYTEIADSAQAGLAEALSALAVAVECPQTLNPSDIVELWRFQLDYTNVENTSKRKQDLVGLILTGLCIMLGTAPIYTNVEQTGKKKHDFLTPAKKMLIDPTRLLDSMLDFDKKNITSDVIKAIQPIIDDPDFQPSHFQSVSSVCTTMCQVCVCIHLCSVFMSMCMRVRTRARERTSERVSTRNSEGVCVCEREREKERKKESEREREAKTECVRVSARTSERKSE